ncbi:hypothetical protein LEL_06867 [Akanthomyces lecanii RCEF 1005]|uniref:SSCRP protein n=1 Tax=Akanthomyces lecanii RCEF 1005 TaxID=1081108 RepID=A0A162N3D3_CORDF|nr:hypothetical protein LEL_06867 [Akanthomyces lecanii RCEF 1005]
MKLTALATVTILPSIVVAGAADAPPQTAHLLFRGPDAKPLYSMSVLADGAVRATSDTDSAVSLIDAPDYNAAVLCDLDFALPPGARQPEHEFTVGADGHTGQVQITPPTPVRGIRCQGSCVETLGTCNGASGQAPKLCCNGYCAANLCRPWDGV